MHVQPGNRKPVAARPAQTQSPSCSCQMPCFDCSPPVLVFWLWPWPKPGIEAQRDLASKVVMPAAKLAVLVDHVGRAAVDGKPMLDDQFERFVVEDVGRVHDRRRIGTVGRVAGSQRAADFIRTNRIDQPPMATHEIDNRQIGARLLRVADRVERRQLGNPLGDHLPVVDKQRRAKPPGQLGNRMPGDFVDLQRI